MAVDLTLLQQLVTRTVDRCPYKLGAKWPLKAASQACVGKVVDCSGYVRWLLDRCGVTLPEYSQDQWAFVRDTLGWREVKYADLHYTQHDPSRLFIAFKKKTKGGHGHAWCVNDGYTIESYGGHGTGQRPWNKLTRYAAACYEVPVA